MQNVHGTQSAHTVTTMLQSLSLKGYYNGMDYIIVT